MSRFDEFWAVYPKKVNKKASRVLWDKIPEDKHSLIITHVEVRVRQDRKWKQGFIKGPDVFLRNENWEDEYERDGQVRHVEDKPVVVDETIPSEGLLGTARAYDIATKADDGTPFTAEQLMRLIWAKQWQTVLMVPDEDNIHLQQLPKEFRKYLTSDAPF